MYALTIGRASIFSILATLTSLLGNSLNALVVLLISDRHSCGLVIVICLLCLRCGNNRGLGWYFCPCLNLSLDSISLSLGFWIYRDVLGSHSLAHVWTSLLLGHGDLWDWWVIVVLDVATSSKTVCNNWHAWGNSNFSNPYSIKFGLASY